MAYIYIAIILRTRLSILVTDMRAPALLALPDTRPGCATCGTFKKTGKISCCAHGGSWFGKCGNVGDSGFYHTWTDGIQVCNAFARESSREEVAHAAFARSQTVTHSVNATERRNATESKTSTGRSTRAVTRPRDVTQMLDLTKAQDVSQTQNVTQAQDAAQSNQVDEQERTIDWETGRETSYDTTDSKGRVKLARLVFCACFMFIIHHVLV